MESLGHHLDRRIAPRQWEGGAACVWQSSGGWVGRCYYLGTNKEVFGEETYAIYQALHALD